MEITQSITDRYANYKEEQNRRQARWLQSIRGIVGECENCGSADNLSCHHVKKRREGGNDNPMNLVILCIECHNLVDFAETSRCKRMFSMVS